MVGSWNRGVPVVDDAVEEDRSGRTGGGLVKFVIGSMGMSTSWDSIRRTRGESNSANCESRLVMLKAANEKR